MARNGSGTFSLLGTLAPAGEVSNPTTINAIMDDIATALTDSINTSGTKAFAANQSFGGFKATSLGSASARTDGANAGQVQDAQFNWADAGGTDDALTATYAPAITTLLDGQICHVRARAANATTTPTFSPNGLTARTIVKEGNVALVAGNIARDGHELILRYDLTLTQWQLLNPAPVIALADLPEIATGKVLGNLSGSSAVPAEVTAVGQHTIWLPALAMIPRTTNGAAPGTTELATNDVMVKYLAFDATTSEAAQAMIQMPKNWDEGTLIFQFLWTHPAAVTYGVKWGVRAVAFANDDALDTAFGTEVEIADTGGTTSDLYISDETAALTVGGSPAAEELVCFEFYRDPADGSDDLNVDAWLIGVKIHYTTNALTDD